MEPTLYSNNILLTERLSARFHRPSRGDVIVAVSPVDPQQFICKRVVALPGDRIYLSKTPELENYANLLDTDNESRASVGRDDGEAMDKKETANTNSTSASNASQTPVIKDIPRGYVWIEGDNTANSADSRYYGPIPIGLIRSRVVCRIWPLTEFRLL